MRDLFLGTGIAHTILLFATVIAIGLYLGRFKFKGISIGSTWILFIGILLSHFGFRGDPHILSFMKDFGLILFVFSIGLQVGPGFFHSFRKGGLTMNMLAVTLVMLAVLVTYVIHLVTGEDLHTMTGVMSGAVTNTPGLGAAQQTLSDAMIAEGSSQDAAAAATSAIASAYAVSYPIGVLGVIFLLIFFKAIFNVDLNKEKEELDDEGKLGTGAIRASFAVKNPAIFGRKIGDEIEMSYKEWDSEDNNMVVKKITVTKSSITGRSLRDLNVRSIYGVTITRVFRSGVELVARPDLYLHVGDSLLAVGPEDAMDKVAGLFGNKAASLSHPNLIPIFFGIVVGVIFGSLPIKFPGIPQPIKLGLAGGPLIIAILLGYFGPKLKITTYTTLSANMMIREIGISFFLAAVGLGAGENFISSIMNGGYWWILYGALITLVPITCVVLLARLVFKLNFYQICGLISGGTTNPPVLAFSQEVYGTNYPSISYATVYPLTMFMRVLMAQLIILFTL